MTAAPLFSGEFFGVLGWALFHFLWQGALVAAGLAAIRLALARKSPATRYAVSCGALALMLALPIATAWSLARRGAPHTAPAGLAPPESAAATALSSDVGIALRSADGLFPESLENRLESFRPWALLVWFVGVLVFSLRFLGDFRAANRMTRRGTRSAPEEWQQRFATLAMRLSIT
ncbi:MAG: energy transducer TonB, partial [Acidobacteriota bacterium]